MCHSNARCIKLDGDDYDCECLAGYVEVERDPHTCEMTNYPTSFPTRPPTFKMSEKTLEHCTIKRAECIDALHCVCCRRVQSCASNAMCGVCGWAD